MIPYYEVIRRLILFCSSDDIRSKNIKKREDAPGIYVGIALPRLDEKASSSSSLVTQQQQQSQRQTRRFQQKRKNLTATVRRRGNRRSSSSLLLFVLIILIISLLTSMRNLQIVNNTLDYHTTANRDEPKHHQEIPSTKTRQASIQSHLVLTPPPQEQQQEQQQTLEVQSAIKINRTTNSKVLSHEISQSTTQHELQPQQQQQVKRPNKKEKKKFCITSVSDLLLFDEPTELKAKMLSKPKSRPVQATTRQSNVIYFTNSLDDKDQMTQINCRHPQLAVNDHPRHHYRVANYTCPLSNHVRWFEDRVPILVSRVRHYTSNPFYINNIDPKTSTNTSSPSTSIHYNTYHFTLNGFPWVGALRWAYNRPQFWSNSATTKWYCVYDSTSINASNGSNPETEGSSSSSSLFERLVLPAGDEGGKSINIHCPRDISPPSSRHDDDFHDKSGENAPLPLAQIRIRQKREKSLTNLTITSWTRLYEVNEQEEEDVAIYEYIYYIPYEEEEVPANHGYYYDPSRNQDDKSNGSGGDVDDNHCLEYGTYDDATTTIPKQHEIHNQQEQEQQEKAVIQEGSRFEYNLIACTMITFRKPETLTQIASWIEYHRLIGFEHFVFYVDSRSTLFNNDDQSTSKYWWGNETFFDYYLEQNLVTLYPFGDYTISYPFFYQFAQQNDCLLRWKHRSLWIGLHDIDEYFQVLNEDFLPSSPPGNASLLHSLSSTTSAKEASHQPKPMLEYLQKFYADPTKDRYRAIQTRNLFFGKNCQDDDHSSDSAVDDEKKERKTIRRADNVVPIERYTWRAPEFSNGRQKLLVRPSFNYKEKISSLKQQQTPLPLEEEDVYPNIHTMGRRHSFKETYVPDPYKEMRHVHFKIPERGIFDPSNVKDKLLNMTLATHDTSLKDRFAARVKQEIRKKELYDDENVKTEI